MSKSTFSKFFWLVVVLAVGLQVWQWSVDGTIKGFFQSSASTVTKTVVQTAVVGTRPNPCGEPVKLTAMPGVYGEDNPIPTYCDWDVVRDPGLKNVLALMSVRIKEHSTGELIEKQHGLGPDGPKAAYFKKRADSVAFRSDDSSPIKFTLRFLQH